MPAPVHVPVVVDAGVGINVALDLGTAVGSNVPITVESCVDDPLDLPAEVGNRGLTVLVYVGVPGLVGLTVDAIVPPPVLVRMGSVGAIVGRLVTSLVWPVPVCTCATHIVAD